MIRHIVFMNMKPEVTDSARESLFEQIRGLSQISSVRRLEIGKLLDAREDWYKERIAKDFGWALIIEFDDEDGLYTYQHHPIHVTVAPEIRRHASGVKIVDFVN